MGQPLHDLRCSENFLAPCAHRSGDQARRNGPSGSRADNGKGKRPASSPSRGSSTTSSEGTVPHRGDTGAGPSGVKAVRYHGTQQQPASPTKSSGSTGHSGVGPHESSPSGSRNHAGNAHELQDTASSHSRISTPRHSTTPTPPRISEPPSRSSSSDGVVPNLTNMLSLTPSVSRHSHSSSRSTNSDGVVPNLTNLPSLTPSVPRHSGSSSGSSSSYGVVPNHTPSGSAGGGGGSSGSRSVARPSRSSSGPPPGFGPRH
ncbi:unnamed protein product [Sympodiomycopsis kandeliae]